MHSERDKMNNYAWWETDGDREVLYSKSHGKIASIWRQYGDWWWECELFECWGSWLCGKEKNESYAMGKVYEYVMRDSKDERKFYNKLVKDLQNIKEE